jgi:hypothetical protein
MCNSLGLNRSLSGLEWNAQTGFGVDDHDLPILPQDYYVNGTKQGSWTEARGLTFVKFDHAVRPWIKPFFLESLTIHQQNMKLESTQSDEGIVYYYIWGG